MLQKCVVGSKVDSLVGFFHHPVMIMSMHAYRYLLFKSGTKQVCKLSLCIDKIWNCYLNTMSSSNITFNYYNIICIAG